MPRYFAIATVMTLIGFAIIGKALYIMTAKKQYWEEVASRLKRDSVSVKPRRGNILSCDGQLMASSIPEYKIYLDFQAGADDTAWVKKRDSLWEEKFDSLCIGLHEIFPSRSIEEFRQNLMEGKKKVQRNGSVGARNWAIWPRRIDYNTFCDVKALPFLSLPKYRGGFHWEENRQREVRPRTLLRLHPAWYQRPDAPS